MELRPSTSGRRKVRATLMMLAVVIGISVLTGAANGHRSELGSAKQSQVLRKHTSYNAGCPSFTANIPRIVILPNGQRLYQAWGTYACTAATKWSSIAFICLEMSRNFGPWTQPSGCVDPYTPYYQLNGLPNANDTIFVGTLSCWPGARYRTFLSVHFAITQAVNSDISAPWVLC